MDMLMGDRELRARLVAARIAERTPCACGADATQLICGPPSRWVCQPCLAADMAHIRAEAPQRDRGTGALS